MIPSGEWISCEMAASLYVCGGDKDRVKADSCVGRVRDQLCLLRRPDV